MAAATQFGGQTMVAALRRVLVYPPAAAGWLMPGTVDRWQELGYLREPDGIRAQAQHEALCRALRAAGVKLLALDEADDLSLDAVYTHDPSFLTDHGAILLRMGKPCREAEPRRHGEFYQRQGIPVLGEIAAPGTAEAGDLVWLDGSTLLAGRGYRTNAAGIKQLRALLAPKGVEVIVAPLPHGGGAATCLHLMSLLSLLDERTALVDLPWLAVETVELLRARGFRLVEIDPDERASLASNVLALGEKHLLAFEENAKTNARLRESGFEVQEVEGSEVGIIGGGGPTCLTRPLQRS